MAIRPLNTIKSWFKTGSKPTQDQFGDAWDSYFHKEEKIPITAVDNLDNIINNKIDAVELTTHISDNNAHGISDKMEKLSQDIDNKLTEKADKIDLEEYIELFEKHLTDESAHKELFDKKADKDDSESNEIKIFRGILNQTGTNAPNVTVLENTLGVELTYSRVGNLDYRIISPNPIFIQGKTFLPALGSASNGKLSRVSDRELKISGTMDGTLTDASLEINIYPGANPEPEPEYRPDLSKVLKTAYIAEKNNQNISSKEDIKILEHDPASKRIKIDYANMANFANTGSNGETWFLYQSYQGSILVDIDSIDIANNNIYYGKTYNGTPNFSVGQKVDFLNPFVNYAFFPNPKQPKLFDTPSQIDGKTVKYMHVSNIIKNKQNEYYLFMGVVYGSHVTRNIHIAKSTNLKDWEFNTTPFLTCNEIDFALKDGNVFSSGDAFELNNGNYLLLLSVEIKKGVYTPAYMIIDDEMNTVQKVKKISLKKLGSQNLYVNSMPLALTLFDGKYRFMVHDRVTESPVTNLQREVHEYIIDGTSQDNLFEFLDNGIYQSSQRIHKGTDLGGYLNGKIDGASYSVGKDQLQLVILGERSTTDTVIGMKRELGVATLIDGKWVHDQRSPLILNPIQTFRKYPEYTDVWGHLGSMLSILPHENTLLLFTSMNSYRDSYIPVCMQVKL